MPTLTRRRDFESQDECWRVYYGDVRIGAIAKRTGIPPGEDPWGRGCGSYPAAIRASGPWQRGAHLVDDASDACQRQPMQCLTKM
jgi:hypothetical protein